VVFPAPPGAHKRHDPALARERLRWTPEIGFEAMMAEMVEADLAALREE